MTELVVTRPLKIKQGATRTLTYRLKDNNRVARDLTDYTAKLEIRSVAGGLLYSSLTSSPAAGITINEAAGEIVPLWTAAQTGAFTFDKAEYDCYITSPAGVVTYIIQGTVELMPRVSQ